MIALSPKGNEPKSVFSGAMEDSPEAFTATLLREEQQPESRWRKRMEQGQESGCASKLLVCLRASSKISFTRMNHFKGALLTFIGFHSVEHGIRVGVLREIAPQFDY